MLHFSGTGMVGTILSFLFLTACDDGAVINVYDKSVLASPVECLSLQVSPPDTAITNTMKKLYRFEDNCPLRLEISYKNGITCNSTFNVQTKAVSGFPSSYLNMEIRRGFSLKYSYYIDLDEDVKPKDLEKGFSKIKEDLYLKERM